ncbi:MAG: transcription antiterminator [Firmicutes bacterium]|nr:transcription antiterminator [Bacillota bacterium]
MENRLKQILKILSNQSYRTAASIGKELNVSEKTVRNTIKDINVLLKGNGAEIISKQKYGYKLKVNDIILWNEFKNDVVQEDHGLPNNVEERVEFLLNYLLSLDQYIKVSDLADQIYVSTNTLSLVLKRVEDLLLSYNIQIDRKPYYGVKAIGHEFDKRCCLIRYFSGNHETFKKTFMVDDAKFSFMFDALMKTLPNYQVYFTEFELQNLAIYLYLTQTRIKQGFVIDELALKHDNIVSKKQYMIAKQILEDIAYSEKIVIPMGEIDYLSIYLLGKRNDNYLSNFVISEKTDYLAFRMIVSIKETFKIDLLDNLTLRMMLNQHLEPLDIRMRYGIPVTNPILADIKRDYFLAFAVAGQAATVLSQYYNHPIPEAEIGWLALIFQIAIENRKQSPKLNILIVCASGKASSHLLKSRFQKEFGEFINTIDVCTVSELGQKNINGIHYIFTTVPIKIPVSVPILEIHDFIQHYEVKSIKRLLSQHESLFIYDFYREEFFFSRVSGNTKEEVLENLIQMGRKIYPLPENLLESVLKRESLGATDFGNNVALPHPFEILTNDDVILVGILEKPIKWNTNWVQVVILISLGMNENENTTKFYSITTEFISNEESMELLIKEPSYDTLLEILNSINIDE